MKIEHNIKTADWDFNYSWYSFLQHQVPRVVEMLLRKKITMGGNMHLNLNWKITSALWGNGAWSVQEAHITQPEAFPTEYPSTFHHIWPHSCCLDPMQAHIFLISIKIGSYMKALKLSCTVRINKSKCARWKIIYSLSFAS